MGDTTIDSANRVFEVMDGVTSFARMAGFAIDGFCEDPSDAICSDFKDTFVELLRLSSIKKLGRYRAESFEYLGQTIDGDSAVVETLARYGDDDVELVYQLRYLTDRWVIVNYVVDGIDTIKNYRKQFSRMLRVESVEEVTQRLRRRVVDLEGES